MSNLLRVSIPLIFLSFVLISPAFAFDNTNTHPLITKKAVENSSAGDYLKENLGDEFSQGVDSIMNQKSVLSWLKKGSTDEDSPMCRASNHFHNPLKSWNQSFMSDDDSTIKGEWIKSYCESKGWTYSSRKSAVTWATGYLSPAPSGTKTTITNQQMGWDNARTYYLSALTASSKTEQENYFASAFQALGQVMHLLEDMAVPAHTRNDLTSHLYLQGFGLSNPLNWFANPFEWYVKENPSLVTSSGATTIDISNAAITRFWDTDTYNGSNSLNGSNLGLSEYTNANFFSDSTIFAESKDPMDVHYFPLPSKVQTDASLIEQYAEEGGLDKVYYVKPYGEDFKLAAYSYFNSWKGLLPYQGWAYNLDDSVHYDYAQRLLPRAVGYSTGLLNYFFRGEISMINDPDISGQYIIENFANESMDGTFTLYYDDIDGNRNMVNGASWDFEINGTNDETQPGKSSSFTFTAPTSPEPKEKDKYILVFQGRMGNEDGAVVGRVVTLEKEEIILFKGPGGNKTFNTKTKEVKPYEGVFKGITGPDVIWREDGKAFLARFDNGYWQVVDLETGAKRLIMAGYRTSAGWRGQTAVVMGLDNYSNYGKALYWEGTVASGKSTLYDVPTGMKMLKFLDNLHYVGITRNVATSADGNYISYLGYTGSDYGYDNQYFLVSFDTVNRSFSTEKLGGNQMVYGNTPLCSNPHPVATYIETNYPQQVNSNGTGLTILYKNTEVNYEYFDLSWDKSNSCNKYGYYTTSGTYRYDLLGELTSQYTIRSSSDYDGTKAAFYPAELVILADGSAVVPFTKEEIVSSFHYDQNGKFVGSATEKIQQCINFENPICSNGSVEMQRSSTGFLKTGTESAINLNSKRDKAVGYITSSVQGYSPSESKSLRTVFYISNGKLHDITDEVADFKDATTRFFMFLE